MVILPLPPRADAAQYMSQYLELRPFYFVERFLNGMVFNIHDVNTFSPMLKQSVVLEPFFNVLLFVPFGVYLRYYYKYSLKKFVVASFVLSLFFELIQLSGLYFIYPRPYRLADVNDLTNNTFDGVVGYEITSMLTFLFLTREELDQAAYKKGQSVRLFRCFVAFLIDWFVLSILQWCLMMLLDFIPKYYVLVICLFVTTRSSLVFYYGVFSIYFSADTYEW